MTYVNLTNIKPYMDADFCGSYKKETSDYPNVCRSRTGYAIFSNDCPIIWKYKLQTEIALSTTKAEYIALYQAARYLILLI